MRTSTETSQNPPSPHAAWPNRLSFARLAAAPIVAGLALWAEAPGAPAATLAWLAAALFALAALTDALDGWLARKLAATSPFGAALDHAADKTLAAAGLIAIAAAWAPLDLVVVALVIVLRDLAVAGLREGLSAAGRGIPVSNLGKLKTFLELPGLAAALSWRALWLSDAPDAIVDAVSLATRVLLWGASVLALVTLARYLAAARR